MHPDDKLEKLVHIGYFKSGKGGAPRPATIRDGTECVELITGGSVFFDDGFGDKERGCGSLFWHHPGEQTINRSPADGHYECLVVLFKVNPPHRRIAPRMTVWDPVETKSFSDEALASFHDDSIDRQTLCRYVHGRLLWAACSHMRRKPAPDLPLPLVRALSAIDRLFSGDLDMDALAVEAGVSVPYLHALFKRHLGEAPHQALLSRRLQEARRLLASSDINLKLVAFNCGFVSVEHFCRVFKERFKMTAASFRRLQAPASVIGGVSIAERAKSKLKGASHGGFGGNGGPDSKSGRA